jgi:serine/threonine-protein kinase
VEFDISPDGRSIAYVGPGAVGGTQLWIRALDDLEPRPIPGTQDASLPRYSPGGDALVFWLANGYSSIALPSGSPSRLLDGAIREVTWGFDGWLYFPRDRGIARIPVTGGEPEMVVDAPEEGDYRVPNALPGGRSMIATHRTGPTSRLVAISLETGAVSDLVEGSMARHTSSGHLVYVRGDGTLFAAPFDEDAAELGPSVEVLAGVEVDGQESSGQFAISQSGTLLYRSGPSRSGLYNLVWVDRDGAVERVDPNWSFDGSSPLSAGADEIGLAISPDGTRVALKIHSDDGEDIWVRDLNTGSMLRLTRDAGVDRRPRWSADGERVVFHSDRGGNRDLWEIPADGTGAPRLLLDLDRPILEVQLSPEWFILRLGGMAGVVGDRDIVGVRRGDTTVVPLAAEPFDEKAMALSPDGRWLAYESTETGTEEIYVRPFPDVEGGKFPVSLEGGGAPRWSVSGDELFFVSRDRQMMAAEILTDGGAFRVGQRLPLFDVDELSINIDVTWATYDLAADGRFLMHQFDIAEEVPRRLVIVENWLEEMKERVGRN